MTRRLVSLLVLLACCVGCKDQATPQPTPIGSYPLLDQIDVDTDKFSQRERPVQVRSIAWNPANDLIAIASDDGVYLYSLSSQTLDKLSDDPNTGALAWNSDGSKLAGASSALWIWD